MMTLVNKYKVKRWELACAYQEIDFGDSDYNDDQVTTAERDFLQAENDLLRIATHPYGPMADLGFSTGTFDQVISNQTRKAQLLDFVLQNW
jgi:esterase/lipase superfamily enzyme